MITTEGKLHIKRYLAGYVNAIAESMAFGIGSAAAVVGDERLQLEIESGPINLTSYDFVNNQLVYKAEIPEEYEGKIYEVGVYSLAENPTNADYASRIITTFDSATEDWVDNSDNPAAFSSTSTRVGVDSLRFTQAASTSTTYNLNDLELDLSGYSAADVFTLAYNVENAFTNQITLRFYTDTGNYYATSLGAQTAGYKIVNVTKGAFTVTGTPSWETITKIQLVVTSTAGGAGDIQFDAIRVNDVDSPITDYILVSRKVLDTPITKVAGMAQDMEFRINITV
jgi:hypothetical protein